MSTASLAPALWMLIPVVAFVLVQVLKRFLTVVENWPPLGKQLLAVVIAGGLTWVAAQSGLPLPTDLGEVDQATIETVLTWVLTVLLGGSSAVGLHAIKKAGGS